MGVPAFPPLLHDGGGAAAVSVPFVVVVVAAAAAVDEENGDDEEIEDGSAAPPRAGHTAPEGGCCRWLCWEIGDIAAGEIRLGCLRFSTALKPDAG